MTDYDELKKLAEARTALMNYQQADMDGIIVKASRQAIHEVDAAVDELLAQNASLKAEVEALQEEVKSGDDQFNIMDRMHADETKKVAELRTALQEAREALEQRADFSEYRSEMMELSSWLGMGLAPNASAEDLSSRIREGVDTQVNVTIDQVVAAIEEASKDYHNTTYGDIVRAVKALRRAREVQGG